jgi:hypothetical protein
MTNVHCGQKWLCEQLCKRRSQKQVNLIQQFLISSTSLQNLVLHKDNRKKLGDKRRKPKFNSYQNNISLIGPGVTYENALTYPVHRTSFLMIGLLVQEWSMLL